MIELFQGRYCLITTSHRGVFLGVVEHLEGVQGEGFRAVLRDCRMVLYWATGGVQALTHAHPDGTRLARRAERTAITHIDLIDYVSEDAEALHRAAKAYERAE